ILADEPTGNLDSVTAAQIRKSLNRPDIVAKAIQLASAKEAVQQSPGTNFKLSDLLKRPVPRFHIVSPAAGATLTGGSAQLELDLASTPDPVKAIRIQVNGRQIAEHLPQKGGGFAPGTLKFPVALTKGRNVIRVVAVNDTGETPRDVIVTHQGNGALDKDGTLYILAIGVDKYPKLGKACRKPDGSPKSCDLNVAGADAKIFANTMEARLSPQHKHVVKRVLVNGASPEDVPTQANILDALGLLRKAQPNDTVMMFVAGHGVTEGLNYNFLTTEAAFSDKVLRYSTIVPWANFQLAIEAAKGRRILFLDTCYSGNSYNQRLTNDAYQANIVVYAAARWDQQALEQYNIGHGLFTYAVVEGMKGKAKNKAGEIRTESLRNYVRERVVALASKMSRVQEPQYFRGRD
ncbi:MAG: caspase family protein, partial [Alphaproteobacteria bacterium]